MRNKVDLKNFNIYGNVFSLSIDEYELTIILDGLRELINEFDNDKDIKQLYDKLEIFYNYEVLKI